MPFHLPGLGVLRVLAGLEPAVEVGLGHLLSHLLPQRFYLRRGKFRGDKLDIELLYPVSGSVVIEAPALVLLMALVLWCEWRTFPFEFLAFHFVI